MKKKLIKIKKYENDSVVAYAHCPELGCSTCCNS